MKIKKFLIILIVVLVLFIPIKYFYRDGGTTEYKSLTYSISKVHKINHNSVTGYDEGIVIKILGMEVFNNVNKENSYNEEIESNRNIIKNDNVLLEESNIEESKDKEKNSLNDLIEEANNKIDNLDRNIFLTDFENFEPSSGSKPISKQKAKEIAQIGFEESASRISSEGTENIESERIEKREVFANNYFTRRHREYDKIYDNIKRECYVVSRENEMGNGVMIYVDIQTGLIIGGDAYGD